MAIHDYIVILFRNAGNVVASEIQYFSCCLCHILRVSFFLLGNIEIHCVCEWGLVVIQEISRIITQAKIPLFII